MKKSSIIASTAAAVLTVTSANPAAATPLSFSAAAVEFVAMAGAGLEESAKAASDVRQLGKSIGASLGTATYPEASGGKRGWFFWYGFMLYRW